MGKIQTIIDIIILGGIGVSLVLGQLIRLNPFPGITIAPYDIFIVLWIIDLALIRKNKPNGTLILSEELLIGVFLFSLLTSLGRFSFVEYGVGILYISRISLYFLLYAYIDNRRIRWLLAMFFISGISVCILGCIQYLTYWDLRNLSYLGWDPHYRRLFSTILDPNIAGLIFIFTLSHAWARAISSRKIINILYVIVSVVSLLFTYSRSSLLAVFIASLVILFIKKEYRIIPFFIVGFFIMGLFLISPNQSYSILRTDTAFARLGSWKEGWEIWKQSPIVGIGFNMLRSVKEPGFIYSNPAMISHATSGIDNWFLFLGATAGILGVIAGIYFYWNMVKIVLMEKINHIALFNLIAVLVHGLFINTIFYPWTFLWLLVCIKQVEYDRHLIYDKKLFAQ